MTDNVVLDVQDLRTYLYTRWGITKAVDGVSFQLRVGETLGIVGESGCGKSMTALSLLRLLPKPAARNMGGRILLDGQDLLVLSEDEMRQVRGKKIALILQDPQTSLNPVFTVGDQIEEAIRVPDGDRPLATSGGAPSLPLPHKGGENPPAPALGRSSKRSLKERAMDLLRMVQVSDPERRLMAFPHQMSGGMKQRVVGAIALASSPKVIIADEPTTSLDVTIQAQYLRLLKSFQIEMGVAIIFITHDFGVVAKMCDRAAVMYAGRIVEQGTVRELFNNPSHPYTEALLGSVPKLEERVERLYSIEGQPPALFDLPPGCHFAARCPHADDRCREEYPPYFDLSVDHTAACWRLEKGAGATR